MLFKEDHVYFGKTDKISGIDFGRLPRLIPLIF